MQIQGGLLQQRTQLQSQKTLLEHTEVPHQKILYFHNSVVLDILPQERV